MVISSSTTLPCMATTYNSSITLKKTTMPSPRKTKNLKPIKNLRASSVIDHNKVRARAQDQIGDLFRGTLDEDANVFTKHFLITSYQLGFDSKASVRAIMNMLYVEVFFESAITASVRIETEVIVQDTAVNHCRASWPAASSGFRVTEEMIRRDLFWVFYRTQIFIDSYPSWDEIVEIQSFVRFLPGKNILVGEGLIRNHDTGMIMIRSATEVLLMNKKTRKFEKINDKVREEIKPHLVDYPIISGDRIKLPQFDFNSAHKSRTGLIADWGDLDINKHVNNAKYIEWILQSIPQSTFDSKELSELILNYKMECDIDSVVQSLTSLVDESDDQTDQRSLEMQHLLRLERGSEVVRARTTWRPK